MNWMWLRLVAAVFWLMVGVAIGVAQAMHPNDNLAWLNFGGVRVSLAWAAVLLSAYNLVRWWGSRAMLAQKKKEAEMTENPRSRPRRREEPPTEPDPNFDFSDKPPGPSEHRNGTK